MKNFLLTIIALTLISCGSKTKFGENSVSILEAKKELTDKFGQGAFYTDLSINDTDQGSIISVTVTKAPSSLKMEAWSLFQGRWTQNSEITLELSEGAKAEDFMYTLEKNSVDFDLLGKLVEQSKEKVKNEKNIEVVTELISIAAPNDGNFKNMMYYITTKPKSGGTTFSFWYKMDGSLDKFDY